MMGFQNKWEKISNISSDMLERYLMEFRMAVPCHSSAPMISGYDFTVFQLNGQCGPAALAAPFRLQARPPADPEGQGQRVRIKQLKRWQVSRSPLSFCVAAPRFVPAPDDFLFCCFYTPPGHQQCTVRSC
jgi:hypothetical protein